MVVLAQEDNGNGDGSSHQIVLRYNTDGTLDSTFNGDGDSDGKITVAISSYQDLGRDIRIESDGKILIAGTSTTPDGNTLYGYLARLTTDGSLDTAFGNGGVGDAPIKCGLSGEYLSVREDANHNLLVGSGAIIDQFYTY